MPAAASYILANIFFRFCGSSEIKCDFNIAALRLSARFRFRAASKVRLKHFHRIAREDFSSDPERLAKLT